MSCRRSDGGLLLCSPVMLPSRDCDARLSHRAPPPSAAWPARSSWSRTTIQSLVDPRSTLTLSRACLSGSWWSAWDGSATTACGRCARRSTWQSNATAEIRGASSALRILARVDARSGTIEDLACDEHPMAGWRGKRRRFVKPVLASCDRSPAIARAAGRPPAIRCSSSRPQPGTPLARGR